MPCEDVSRPAVRRPANRICRVNPYNGSENLIVSIAGFIFREERHSLPWPRDAEIRTGENLSRLGLSPRRSLNSSKLCASTSSPPTNICGRPACGSGLGATRTRSTFPSLFWKLGDSRLNPLCNRCLQGFDRSLCVLTRSDLLILGRLQLISFIQR